ncbi:hypothetical protein [Enterococcus termitis]|uniref:Lipoprotein n=1 Tax=Enterococcus termitis TaxID=332950 RepID=A0A1E5GHY6_9ENTE|nr:hypothetical protein [Enterococcus termitis]OEG12336.1 hypothetical protein BCR25_07290 [Enterococcus termitis]OJG98835.1 hypothetical protein RV18_GL002697 [Enterococcus termitis]
MRKVYLLGIVLGLFVFGGCTQKKNEQSSVTEPWLTIDNHTVEADENGQFELTGKAKYSSFSAKVAIKNNSGNTTQGTRGILKIDKDGTFVWRNIFIDGHQPTTDVSFYTYKEKEKMNYTVNVDYSEYVARKEADQLAEEKMNQTMPTLLAEIVTESEGTIVKIDKKRSSYKSLLVTVPLTVKYERNGEKKKYMDTIGFFVQDKTADTLYPEKEQIPYITFRYETTDELLGGSDLINRRKFILYDDGNY